MAGFLKRKRKSLQIVELQLSSLIDIFATLIFFLLSLFASGAGVVSGDITLPKSISQKEIEADTIVAITPNYVLIEGFKAANVDEVAAQSELLIAPLSEKLEKIRKRAEAWQRAGATLEWEGRVIIQADKDTPFEVLKKVLATCGKNGFSMISLAVLQTDQVF